MAKAKKAKNEEQRGGDNSEAIVKHQKLCLSIDMDNRRVYGYTELQIVVPEDGIVGLHADNLVIERVTVDGEPARFEVFPHYQHLDPKDRWRVVSSATSAADASGSVYLSSLELELLPNLLIMCSNSSKPDNRQEEDVDMDKGEELSFDANRLCSAQNVKTVRIEYWVEKAETGIHFNNNVLHTNNQLRRARCWFPCIDDSLQCCCYDLEFTVASDFVAVSSGTLLHQVLTNDDPPRKTYVYKLNVPVAAQWISLAVAPFEILPDRHGGLLSHFCLPANLSKLQNTVGFFHNAFSHFEDYLSSSFPFGSFSQVFIGPEMAISSWSLGASVNIFSSHVMFDERIIDQTIETRIRLAYSLARQWFGVYITPEAPNDEWLLDGLAGFLTDSFIKRFLGNNEVRYRRYKANNAVCQADDSAGTALSSPLASKDLYGTQCIGFYGKIRSWKSVAVLQMLEKQMGPESFRKILQSIILRARDGNRSLRTLSTKEFRHSANKIGNLERPFLKEFFPRWVGSCGCPVLKMGFNYNKRKNMLDLAVLRGCTSRPDSWTGVNNINHDSENRESDVGWPGMMSIRVHELDGMYDHPILPMAGEPWQLLEIQCHSKLAAKRFQKTKKGTKADGSDDNGDAVANTDVRSNSESPLLWYRADPEMEYLAEIHCNQPVQMWINQLEKDKDVIAQAQAIAVLEALPQLPFSVVNALNSFLCDSKAFWRVRIQAAYTLATTTSEDTDWTGLFHLINFYKSRRFDPNINLPRPNDFHDFQEYFVLEAIPLAIASVRSTDKKSPREAVEFILQLLKYNDNTGNVYSDVFWLAALVRSVGELEFGQQSIVYLPSLLKRIDRLLQFDRLMPSHNGILTISCIQALTQCALKLSEFIPLDSVTELIKPYVQSKTWQIRIVASRSLLELECQGKGIDAALLLFISHLNNETSLRGQTKLGVCALRLSQMANQSRLDNSIQIDTLVALLRLLESPVAFNNITLRHYIFCILQVLAGRSATLFGVPRDEILRMGHTRTFSELKIIFAALINQSKPQDPSSFAPDNPHNIFVTDDYREEVDVLMENHKLNNAVINDAPDVSLVPITQGTTDAPPNGLQHRNSPSQVPEDDVIMLPKVDMLPEIHEPMEQLINILGDNFDDPVASRTADNLISADKESEPVFDLVQDSLIMREALNEANALLALNESNALLHDSLVTEEANNESDTVANRHELNTTTFTEASLEPNALVHDNLVTVEATKELNTLVHDSLIAVEATKEPNTLVHNNVVTVEATKEVDTVSNSREIKKPKLKIRVKQSAASIRAEIPNTGILNSQDRYANADRGASSSLSVDALRTNIVETVSTSNQNFGDANSSRDVGSRVTASTADRDELVKELQCTADSSIVSLPTPPNDRIHISTVKHDPEPQTSEHTYSASLDIRRHDAKESSGLPTDVQHSNGEGKKKKKDKDKKRKRNDDPEHLELKRQKKEKKRRKKEMAKILADTSKVDLPSNEKRVSAEARPTLLVLGGKGLQPGTRGDIVGGQGLTSSADELRKRNDPGTSSGAVQLRPGESSLASAAVKPTVNAINLPQSTTSNKIKIKLKTRTIDKP